MIAKSLMPAFAIAFVALGPLGCSTPDPNQLPPVRFYLFEFFPYIVVNSNYDTQIHAANTSSWAMDVTITFRTMGGAVASTQQLRLKGHETHTFEPGAMEGSVELTGIGDDAALQAQLEMRSVSGPAAAMDTSAGDPIGHPWLFHQGVIDEADGLTRSNVVTASFDGAAPIYVDSIPLTSCGDWYEACLQPRAFHVFQPADEFSDGVGTGPTDFTVYTEGHTGPNWSGQTTAFTGCVLTTSPYDIAMSSYTDFWSPYWTLGGTAPDQCWQIYFADVEDDGANRADRLYVKCNGWTEPAAQGQHKVHFYTPDGVETTKTVTLTHRFGAASSQTIISPKQMLGKDFMGSVWVESQVKLQGTLRRISPGNWADRSQASVAGAMATGCIPYVSTTAPNWRYEVVLFYPSGIYPPPPEYLTDTPPPIRYVSPSQAEPGRGRGEVVLTLYSKQGVLEGWVVVYLEENQTAYVDINNIASNYLQKSFEGNILFDPFVVVELELVHEQGLAHGSASMWKSGVF